jgi:hypothetical protein
MVVTAIEEVSDILTDEHGYTYVNLLLSRDVRGFYPNSVEFLSSLQVGDKVRYVDTKMFNGRLKINGLLKIETDMQTGNIKSVGEVQAGDNNKFFAELELTNGVKALCITDSAEEILSYKKYDKVKYADVVNLKGKDIFNKLVVHTKTDADERQLSIIKQSAFGYALEIATIASPKGRWVKSDGSIDFDKAIDELREAADKIVEYTSPW